MHLYTLKPAEGSRRRHVRVGRGIGSGLGVRPGFEGGQMPLKIRLPKFGFYSPKSDVTAEVLLNDLNRIEGDVVDMASLLKARLITKKIKYVKIVLSKVPNLTRKLEVKGLGITRGAKAAIEAAGGTVEVAQYTLDAAARREKSQKRSAAKKQMLQDKLAATGIVKPAKKDKADKAEKAAKNK